jgi:hypothetical protein
MAEVEKILCCDKGNDDNPWAIASMMNNSNNSQWNNPFIYLVWMMFAQRMWGNDYNKHYDDPQYGYNALSNQIASFQTRMQDNHNTDLLFSQAQNNNQEIRAGVDKITSGQALLQQVLCGIEAGIKEVGGKVGFSAERVINAVNVGDCNVIQALKDCCCTTQQNIIRMGYENQLGQKDQMFATQKGFSDLTFATQAGFDRTNTGLERGFSATAFQAQQDKCDIIRSNENNTQRIIDTLNNHWKDEQANQIQDLKFQLSQERQNNLLLRRLGGKSCGDCNDGCW